MVALGIGGDNPLNRGLDALRAAFDGKVEELKRSLTLAVPKTRCGQTAEDFEMRAHMKTRPGRVYPRLGRFAAIIPGNSVAEQVLTMGVSNFLSLYNTVIIARILLTWFPNAPAAISGPLGTLADPYLNLFRGLIPPLGGTLDLSPILAFVVLDLFSNTASALPAEVGATGEISRHQPNFVQRLSPSFAARAWQRRIAARRRRLQETAAQGAESTAS